MTSQANNRNGGMLITRNERSMPKWVSEQSDRIGPRPPPPPSAPENGLVLPKEPSLPPKTKQPEPDYEVIEFSNQQYSNAPLRPNSASSGSKTPDNKLKCTLCGSGNPWVTCEECAQQLFCASCDDMFHKHPKRKNHQRKTIEKSRPPLPPKVLPGQPGPTAPVAPPRRNKRGLITPIMQRKDQGNAMPGPFPIPSSPTPSMKNSSWQERFGSLPRGLNLLNRPLPETPKTPSESSRSTTPKSVFDNIQRPPSVALEKIKSKANATLDRMQLLQQRYRQQKEQMERERSGSVTDQRQMALQHHQIAAQRANQLGQRGISSSVFNLSHINRKQPMSNNGWMNNHLQQAQSVAQLNCSNCAQHQPQWNGTAQHHMHMPQDPWSNQLTSQQHLNRSNMSLNVSAGYMMQPQMNGMYPPPTFMNQRNLMQQMYPQPYIGGMPIMNPGLMAMPPSTSRAGSRMASPAMSRKSVTLRRKQRSSYIDDEATDDEDSDEDDRRSITSARSGVSRTRQRRMSSASQIQPEDDIDSSQVKLHRNRARNQRRDSVAKSIHNDWAPGRRTSSSNNNRSADSGFNSPLKPSRIYSDLDSEGSATRALVQAKIEQKLKEESLKQKHSKPKRQSQSPTPQKTSSAVQTQPVKHSSKSEKMEKPIEELSKQPKAPSENEAENVVQQKKNEESRALKEKQATKEEEDDGEKSESESEESHDSESVNENEQTQQIEENEIEEDDLGPPPSTPDHEWECEFCTFVNEANIKICTICCKTPSIKPKKVLKSISPPKQTKITAIEKDKESTNENKPVKIKSGTIKKTPLTLSSEPSAIQNAFINNTESLQTPKTDSAHNTEDRIESAANTLKNKESVEDIWAVLDENIQNTTHEVTRKAESKKPAKISTACGNITGSASVELRDTDSKQSQARAIGTSPPPQSISTQTYDTLPPAKSDSRKETVVKPPSQPIYNDIIQESDIYKHTTEELNAALKYCGPDMHPLVWLRDNWPKLIQTVQSLATKYGQERAENTIGTISQMEAREALRMHTGNIWQAVSECIEQRQRKYREIFAKGNFSREDIVTALTTHQGNVELALMDLGRSQLKPFLMRIWGSPGGVENESGSQSSPATTHSSQSTHYNMNKDIHNFLSANASECMQKPNTNGAFSPNNLMPSPFDRPVSSNSPFDSNNHMLDNTSSYSADSKDFANSPLPLDESILSNKNVLKDLETLIGNIEHNQQNQNEQVIRSVNDITINVKPKTENEYDSESMRILTKSPINSPKLKTTPNESNLKNEADVKNFVWQHIQEIVPNLVHQVEMELMEDIEQKLKNNEGLEEKREISPEPKQVTPPPPPPPPPIDQDEFLMEEVIKPNIRNAVIREELPPHYFYTAEIATFQMAFDRGLERIHIEEYELETLEDASKRVYKMFKAPEVQMIQDDEKIMTPHEVKINLTDTLVQQLISSIPQTDSSNAVVPICLQAQFELQEAISSESQFDATNAEGPVTFGAQSDLTQSEIKTAISSDFQHDSSNVELSAFIDIQSEVQVNKEIPTLSKNDDLEGIKPENVQTLDEVNIDKDVIKTITSETHNELLEYNREIQPSNNNSLHVSSETKVEKLRGETNTQTVNEEIPSTSQWEYNLQKENLSEVHTFTKVTNDKIMNQKYQQTNGDPSVLSTSSLSTIPGTTSTNEPVKTFSESLEEKEQDANSASQITKPNKESKIQTKTINLQQRTTVKELEQAKAETKMNNVGSYVEIVPIASDNNLKKPEVGNKDLNSPKNQGQPEESNKNMNNNDSQSLSISVQITENTPSTSQTSTISNKPFSTLETNVTSNETLASISNRISKIPVRRTFSNKNLISHSTTLTKTSSNKDLNSPNFNLPISTRENEIPKSRFKEESPNSLLTEDESEEELNSIESESSTTNITSRADQLQSPSTASQMFLVIQREGTENTSTVAPSTSSSTLHSTISQSSGLKSPTEFIPSGDPSKQNLTELVEDTQRLIKQMKDEISIDDFESSTDDDDYSEEYSDEYDDGEEEEEEEEEWEEEDEENEDDEEYDDLTEEITEENELFSVEGDSLSQPQSPQPSQESQDPREIRNRSALSNITGSFDHSQALLSDHFEQDELTTKKSNDTHTELYSVEGDSLSKPQSPPPSQESQDPIETRNSSALSNITESFDHSQALLSDHFEQDELTTKSNVTHNKNHNVEDTAAFVESENSLLDQPVATLLENNFDNSQSFMQLIELPKSLPETSVETVLSSVKTQDHSNAQNYSKDKTALVSGLKDILSARISISNELGSENSIPELPVEIVLTKSPTQQANDDSTLSENKDLEDVDKLEDSQKNIKISQTENELPSSSKKQLPTGPKESMKDANQLSTMTQNATIDPSKKIKESIIQSQVETESLTSNVKIGPTNVSDSLATKEDLPTTSTSKNLSLTSVQNTPQRKSNTANATSSSKSLENKKKSNNETKTPVKKSPAASKIPKPKETPKEPKPKETPTKKPQNELKKKLYTRSKSFSGPPTPIGIASVKSISQKFISPNPNAKQLTTPKNYPTVPRKSSIVEAINKLNKPFTSTENPAVSAIFKSRTQPRIPKKKYHETCFSDDDYESSTSEEEIETLEVRQRKLSVPVFRAYPSVQEPKEVTTEDLVEKFMREELSTTIAEAQIAAALVSMKFQQDVSIWAAKECSDLDHAVALLKQECELCSGTYALNQIVSMLKCTHKCCKQCVKTYFTVQITERSINDCSCPFCKLPELHNQTEHEDEYLEYFSNLDIFLKSILEPDVHELFQRKLRDRTLLKDPNFKWCMQCSSGFFARPKQKRLICPDCGSVTCAQCRKTWKKQHEGISCDQYSEWESANDPEVQAKEVKQHLEQNGIDCPKCKFRYSLTRGGCMHFTCTQCKYEFCYGCAKPFMMGAKCTISPYCAKLGLHAHHPRNCLFYLRDKLPVQLQILLKNNNESFEVDPIEVPDSENDNEPSSSKKKEQLCPIPIQKETPTGLVDTKCNGDVPEKHAGMCRTHYVEYLTAKVAKAKIDPLPIFDLTDCVQELRRRGIALPERGPWDTDEIYKNMCTEVIQKNIPLDITD